MGWLLPEMDEDGGYVVTNTELVEKLVRTTHVFTACPERERERGYGECTKKTFSENLCHFVKKPQNFCQMQILTDTYRHETSKNALLMNNFA